MNEEKTRGNGQVTDADGPGIGQRIDQMGEDARRFVDDARGAVEQIGATLDLRGRVQRHPYGMMLAAFGVGYVLGGGLFTPATARVLRLGLRLAALPLVKDELIGMAEAALEGLASRSTGASGGPGGRGPETYNPEGGSR